MLFRDTTGSLLARLFCLVAWRPVYLWGIRHVKSFIRGDVVRTGYQVRIPQPAVAREACYGPQANAGAAGSSPGLAPTTVLFLTGSSGMAGVEFNAIRLAQRLDPKRWRVVVACCAEGEFSKICRAKGIELVRYRRPRLFSTSIRIGTRVRVPNPFGCLWDILVIVMAAVSVVGLLRKLAPALVVTKGLFPHFYGALAARWCGIPCIWHAEDLISERWWGMFRRCFAMAARWLPSCVVVIGEPIARQLPSNMLGRVRVIHNGSDTDAIKPGLNGAAVRRELGLPADTIVIGHVGRLTPWKGQHHLLEAFARLAHDLPKTRLLLVGSAVFESDAFEQYLRKRAGSLGLAERIIFAGYRRDVPRVLGALDILAYTSVEKDNCPLSLLEAMAAGLPIVAYDIEGIRLVLSDPQYGLLVPVENVEALADNLKRIILDRPLRESLAKGARVRVEQAFSLTKHVRQFDSVMSSLLCERRFLGELAP